MYTCSYTLELHTKKFIMVRLAFYGLSPNAPSKYATAGTVPSTNLNQNASRSFLRLSWREERFWLASISVTQSGDGDLWSPVMNLTPFLCTLVYILLKVRIADDSTISFSERVINVWNFLPKKSILHHSHDLSVLFSVSIFLVFKVFLGFHFVFLTECFI